MDGPRECFRSLILAFLALTGAAAWGQATFQSDCAHHVSSGTSTTCTIILQAPSFLINFVGLSSTNQSPFGTSDTATNGWSTALSSSSGAIFYAANTSTGSDTITGTVTGGSNYWTLFSSQWTGVATSSPFDVACQGTTAASSGNSTFCTLTLALPNELAVISLNDSNTGYDCDTTTGWVDWVSDNGRKGCYKNAKSSGSMDCRMNNTTAGTVYGVCAAFKTTNSIPPPPTTEYVRGVWVFDQGTLPPPPSTQLAVISVNPLPSAAVNASYQIQLQATGGTLPYTWAVASGTLPMGLSLDAATGTLSGMPTMAGSSSFTVQVTDSVAVIATKSLALTVVAASHWVALNWDPSGGADSYNVKRSTFNGGSPLGLYPTIATGVGCCGYSDGNVKSGITYYYVVSAVNKAGESDNSNQTRAIIP